ncbi:hypothetical protein PCANC_08411 [Puccinia coronata f. sp. avenae]|uniref:Uncharacterized protein n=1 Tax=Puccinia coronata f. sp. avenae TaxID=200324 RepID=A0A2N5VPQ5_9BASI|nr:hypothetical protein PCANC_08411 [Puccinia coronata f. sp. avenae]
MSLSSLSKLALVLHPTNCSSDQDLLLLLYSSVIEDEMWHLSLIGPTIPQNHAGSRETWWEGKWSMEDLRKTLPSKSPDEIIENIRSSFSNDDVTLIGYREGNEAEVRVTIGYSTPGAFTIPLARLNPPSDSMPASNQKPFLNLLDITCEAYRQLNSRKHEAQTEPTQGDANRAMTQSSSSQTNATQKIQRTISAQALFARNLANPHKKARVTVSNGFLPSDDSDS